VQPSCSQGPASDSARIASGTAPDAPAWAGGRRLAGPLRMLLRLAGLALLIQACVFHLSVVRGSSMAPGIHDGDRILVDPLSYVFGEVGRGDIVVLRYPLDPSIDYIKRVIGLPGDKVVLAEGRVWVNGVALDEPYVGSQDASARLAVEVLPAHYFVLGDNRPRSCDSRDFGLVPSGYVRGKVELRLWPPGRIGRIDGGLQGAPASAALAAPGRARPGVRAVESRRGAAR
jgi:signal peptidase I